MGFERSKHSVMDFSMFLREACFQQYGLKCFSQQEGLFRKGFAQTVRSFWAFFAADLWLALLWMFYGNLKNGVQ